jgi:hypothetical protein
MLWRRTFALLLAVAVLALPASSFAQSAGDDQYQDPLAGQGGGSGGGGSTGGGGGGHGTTGSGSSAPTTAPAASTPSGSGATASGTQPAAATGAGTANGQLPRTGFDVIITIELGLAMLLSGLVAQRLLVLRDRRPDRH